MDYVTAVKLAVYQHFADTGTRPAPQAVVAQAGGSSDSVLAAYRQLQAQRVLVLEDDGFSIRMAPPFSGVPTQHVLEAGGVRYYANCAWDALGVAAALGRSCLLRSRCEGSGEPLEMQVGLQGPEPCDWIFHSVVPAAHWWDDIVFT